MRILIVEDNPDAAGTLKMILAALGHEARAVPDGETALATFPEFRPAMIILDLGLPGIQGHETASRIRALQDGERATIIVLSGWGREEDRERSRLAGIDHHLLKPLDLEKLKALLERAERDD